MRCFRNLDEGTENHAILAQKTVSIEVRLPRFVFLLGVPDGEAIMLEGAVGVEFNRLPLHARFDSHRARQIDRHLSGGYSRAMGSMFAVDNGKQSLWILPTRRSPNVTMVIGTATEDATPAHSRERQSHAGNLCIANVRCDLPYRLWR